MASDPATSTPLFASTDERLRAEAVRVYLRYAIEVVEALGLCPWARRARLDGRTLPMVIVTPDPRPEDVLPCIDEVAADPRLDIGLVLFPRLRLDRQAFHRFVAHVRDHDVARHASGCAPLLMADFHPEAEPDLASPARLVSFIRRTPDPTIQLVRRTTLDAEKQCHDARLRRKAGTPAHLDNPASCHAQTILASLAHAAGLTTGQSLSSHHPEHSPLHEQIAINNHATITRRGVDRLRAVLDDIRHDRDLAYARVAAPSR